MRRVGLYFDWRYAVLSWVAGLKHVVTMQGLLLHLLQGVIGACMWVLISNFLGSVIFPGFWHTFESFLFLIFFF